MSAASAQRQVETLLLVALTLLAYSSVVVRAAWTVATVRPPPSVVLREDFVSGDSISISFTCDSAQFANSLINARDVFMGSCSSSVPIRSNPFGFERWKSFFTTTRTVEIRQTNGLDNSILLTFAKSAYGYTIAQSEFITCQISPTYVSIGSLGAATSVSFAIVPNFNGVQARLLTKNDTDAIQRKAIWWSSLANPFATTYTESTIRRDGLMLMVTLINDAWNIPTIAPASVANFSCSCPGDDSACGQIVPWLRNIAYISYNSVDDPRTVRVEIPRNETRLFNTKAPVDLCMIVNPNSTSYGYKRGTIIAASVDTCFTLVANTFQSTVLYISELLRNATNNAVTGQKKRSNLQISEACIRGRSNDVSCGWSLYFTIDEIASQEFIASDMALTDLQQAAFYSTSMQIYLNIVLNMSTIQQQSITGPSLVDVNLLLARRGDSRYQIDAVDTIQVRMPFSAMSRLESPSNMVTLTVIPSPGDLIGSISNSIMQSQFWSGNFQWALRMGGERWVDAVISNVSVLVTQMVGSRGEGDPNSNDTWYDWRSCVLPSNSLAFETINGVVNKSVLLLNFQECPQYTVRDPNETVTISAQASFGQSGLGYNVTQNLTFIVFQSPPSYIVTGQLNFTEDTIQTAGFLLQLQGGSKFLDPLPAACVESIRSSTITTNEPTDPTAWSNSTTRAGLLVNATIGYDRFGIPSRLTLVFNASYYGYQNLRGEKLRFGQLSNVTCVANSEPVGPGTNYTILVTPRIPVLVGPELLVKRPPNNSSGIVYTNTTVLSSNETLSPFITSTDVRASDMTIVLTIANDTFRSTLTPTTVIQSIAASTTAQPAGFMAMRARIFPVSNVDINATTVVIRFQPDVLQYAITSIEIIVITVDSLWVTSEQNVGALRFRILPTPGEILLQSWTGQSLGVAIIDEDVVRGGNLWFQFAMIGDQWRQERDPYVAMFRGPTAGEATGLLALVDELVPSIEYFNFTSSDTYQYLTVRLQASDAYDISALETIQISFSSDAASSGLAPKFDLNDGSFTFQVRPAAGRLVASGPKVLTEKGLREGGAVLYLTLFGETWIPAAAQCVRNATSLTAESNSDRNSIMLSSALPVAAFARLSDTLVGVSFQSAKAYALPTGTTASDVILLNLTSGRCFSSGIAPPQTPVGIEVTKTRGEMTLTARTSLSATTVSSSNTIDTNDMTSRELDISLEVSGTQWKLYNLVYDPATDVNESLHGALQNGSWCALSDPDSASGGLWLSCCVSNVSCADSATTSSSVVNMSLLSAFLSQDIAENGATFVHTDIRDPIYVTRNATVVPGLTLSTSSATTTEFERRMNLYCPPPTTASESVWSVTFNVSGTSAVVTIALPPNTNVNSVSALFFQPMDVLRALANASSAVAKNLLDSGAVILNVVSLDVSGCEALLQNVSTTIDTVTTTRRVSTLLHGNISAGNVTTVTTRNVTTSSTVSTTSTRHKVSCKCGAPVDIADQVLPLNADDPSTLVVTAGTAPPSSATATSFTSLGTQQVQRFFTAKVVSSCACSLIAPHIVPSYTQALKNAGWLPSAYHTNLAPSRTTTTTLVNALRVEELISNAFTSTASPIEEPSGFAAHSATIISGLAVTNTVGNISFFANASVLSFRLKPASGYSIVQDEVITMTLTQGDFLVDDLLPDPNVGTFTVSALPQTLMLVYTPPGGQFSASGVATNVRTLLAMPAPSSATPDASIRVSQVGRDGIAYVLSLEFNVTPSQEDPRSNAELTNHLISLSPTYLSSSIGVTCAVLNGTPCTVAAINTGAAAATSGSDSSSLGIWIALCVVAVLIVGGITYISLMAQLTTLSGSMRRKHQAVDKIRYLTSAQAEGSPTAGATTANESVAGPLAVQASASELQHRPMSLKEYAQHRRLLEGSGKRSASTRGGLGSTPSGVLQSLTYNDKNDDDDEDDMYRFSRRDLEDDDDERHHLITSPVTQGGGGAFPTPSSSAIPASPSSRTLQSVLDEQRRSERVDAALREKHGRNRGGAKEVQKALDLRADFQLL